MTKQKDYIGKWGYKFFDIMNMPRDQFAMMFGLRYLEYSKSKFYKIIQRETPYCEFGSREIYQRFEPDKLVNSKEYKALQSGVWDSVNMLI